jgi:hypothetical protein
MPAHRDPDEQLVVLFKYQAMENPEKTLKEGRPIFDDVEVCEIRSPGSKDVKVFPSTAISADGWKIDPFTGQQRQESYAERFAHQYRQFKASAAQTKTGTPLEHAPFLSDGRRAELRAQNVYTVEQLAAIDGNELKNLGPFGREMKNKAVEFIEESKSAAPNKQMLVELEALKARNAILEEDAIAFKNAKSNDEGEFEPMTLDQLKEFIAANTGRAPVGQPSRKTLVRMAMDCKPEKVA